MLGDITIYKDYPIINGFVQVPPNEIYAKDTITVQAALTAIPGSRVVSLRPGSGYSTGGNFGAQHLFRIPAQQLQCCARLWDPDPAVALGQSVVKPGLPVFATV